MRCFLMGSFGVLVALVMTAMIHGQYSDYRTRSEMASWVVELQDVRGRIAQKAEAAGSLRGITRSVPLPHLGGNPEARISEDGWIAIQGGRDAQSLLLIPELKDGRVRWRCVGGTRDIAPRGCDGLAHATNLEQR